MSSPVNVSVPQERYDRVLQENESLRKSKSDLTGETWMLVMSVASACFFVYAAALPVACCFLSMTIIPISLMIAKRNLSQDTLETLKKVTEWTGRIALITSLACVVIGVFTMNMPLLHISIAASYNSVCLMCS